jgi:hypothetical protein
MSSGRAPHPFQGRKQLLGSRVSDIYQISIDRFIDACLVDFPKNPQHAPLTIRSLEPGKYNFHYLAVKY